METKKAQSFVKEVVARIKGDNATAIGERNYRLASAAVKGQLSKLDGEKVKAEIALEKEQDKLHAAIYPVDLIEDDAAYNKNIVACQNKVDSAQENLDDIEDSIEYFKKLSDKVNAVS